MLVSAYLSAQWVSQLNSHYTFGCQIRWKAQRQRIVIAPAADPDASDKSLHADMAKVFADTVAATSWAPPHVERADPFLQERLRQIGEAEHEFLYTLPFRRHSTFGGSGKPWAR